MSTPSALQLDPEYAAAIAPYAEMLASRPKFPAGDALSRREMGTKMMQMRLAQLPSCPDVTRKDHSVPLPDGHTLIVSEFAPAKVPTGLQKCIYFIHGGGYILGSVDLFEKGIQRRVTDYGVKVFAVQYRLAPEHRHPVPLGDCWAGLEWLSTHAEEVGVDKARIVVLGDSAGGGLAASLTLMARDKSLNPPIKKQILIYPMLDDRNTTVIPGVEEHATWKCDDNITGWKALLGPDAGNPAKVIPAYGAAARVEDVRGLPETYIEVGQLDIFCQENVEFGRRLVEASVPVELHVYPGMPHAFQGIAPEARFSLMSMANVKGAVERA